MRADEVLRLNVGDVVLDAAREGLRVREAKNNRDQIVVDSDLMKRSLRLLRFWLRELGAQAATTKPLFGSNCGTHVSYDALHYQWIKICPAANLMDVVDGQEQPRYTIHQLRYTVDSNLIRELPEQIVNRILGQRDPRSSWRYVEVNEEQVRMALAQKRPR